MGSEMGGLSTALGLFASPPLILSTESVVAMEWKGMSTSIATWAALPAACCSSRALDVLMPFHSTTTTDSVESISGGLAKSPSAVHNPPTSLFKDAGCRV